MSARAGFVSVAAGLLLLTGCPATPTNQTDDDITLVAVEPRGSDCGAIAIACYDEFARQPAKIICFREQARWQESELTWRIAPSTISLTDTEQAEIATSAFALWAAASSLSFAEVDDGAEADIEISFSTLQHGDAFPFDGSGGNLGHAFFPGSPRPGQVHLCAAENWADTDGDGSFDFFTVLLHELGHALGLEHSLDPDAVMAPAYSGAVDILTTNDIDAIQRLYGSRGGDLPPIIERDADFEAFCAEPADLTALGDPDTDGDGIPDTIEAFVLGTEPLTGDTDDDGSNDFIEVFINLTDPADELDVSDSPPDIAPDPDTPDATPPDDQTQDPPPDDGTTGDPTDTGGGIVDPPVVPEPAFTLATITQQGAEHLIAGPGVDPSVSSVTPAGYAPRSYSVSGDGSRVWFTLFDEFPNVEGDPQTQLWVVNTDGTGALRSAVTNQSLNRGLVVRTNLDGSVAVFENIQDTTFQRATPGAAGQLLFNESDLGHTCSSGTFRISDDGSQLVFVDFCGTRVFFADLNTSPVTPVQMAGGGSFEVNGFTAREIVFEIDISADASTWTVMPSIFEPVLNRVVDPIYVGTGLSSAPALQKQTLITDNPGPRNLNMTDDGSRFGYCVRAETLFAVANCYVQDVGGTTRHEITDGVSTLAALALSDDGNFAYVRSNAESGLSSGYGYINRVGEPAIRLVGSDRFNDSPSPGFSAVRFNDDGSKLVSAVTRGMYLLHNGIVPTGFPSIDEVSYRYDGENCALIVRARVTAPLGIESVTTIPMFQGREPTTIVDGEQNALYRERFGGGTFAELPDQPGVWERTIFLTNSLGECARTFVTSDYEIRIVLVEATASRTVFKDFIPTP